MTGVIPCPLCDWTIERPEPQSAPGVASALGLPAGVLASIHRNQNMRRIEQDLEQHLGSHKLAEWVTALTKARLERDTARDPLGVIAEARTLTEALVENHLAAGDDCTGGHGCLGCQAMAVLHALGGAE